MSNILILEVPQVNVGLTTQTYTVPAGAGGVYNIRVQLTENPPSGLTVVVNKNGSPIYTAPVITPSQIAQQFTLNSVLLAAADVITIVLSSAVAIDSQKNTVKTSMSIGRGA